MKIGWRKMIAALRPGRVVMMAFAILLCSFAMMIGKGKEPAEMNLPDILPTPGAASHASGGDLVIRDNCEIIQTMAFLRCGHSVTRRIRPPDTVTGMDFGRLREYYDLWMIESYSPSAVEMRRELELFCPMHDVLSVNGAGEIVLSKNLYGDGMAVVHTYNRLMSGFDEETAERLILGISFDSREEAEAWLALH